MTTMAEVIDGIEVAKLALNAGALGLNFFIIWMLARFAEKNAPAAWRILELSVTAALTKDKENKECPECAKRKKSS